MKQRAIEVFVEPDDHPENPADWSGWQTYSFCKRHMSYKDPKSLGLGELGADGLPKILNPGLRRKLEVGLAFFLSYYEHGNCIWGLIDQVPYCRFDSIRIAGLIIWKDSPGELGARTYAERA